MESGELSREDFDALVTGELTHFALWLEEEIGGVISDYFVAGDNLRSQFAEVILRREGLTFQDKIEIVRAITPLLEPVASEVGLRRILDQVESFKAWRNAFAHGRDVGDPEGGLRLDVEVVSRSGKPKRVSVTPDSHRQLSAETEKLLGDLQAARRALRGIHGGA